MTLETQGHPKHERPPFEEAKLDRFFGDYDNECPDCGGEVLPSPQPPRAIQPVKQPTGETNA